MTTPWAAAKYIVINLHRRKGTQVLEHLWQPSLWLLEYIATKVVVLPVSQLANQTEKTRLSVHFSYQLVLSEKIFY